MNDQHLLLPAVLAIAISAGRRILEVYSHGFEVTQKPDHTPVTEADLAASAIIEKGLKALTPDIPVISEESATIHLKERGCWPRFWLVDPLDGTREFIDHTGEFTVNIALIEGDQSVLGVVYAPVLGLTYYASKGGGAFKRDAIAPPHPIRVRQWPGDETIVACGRAGGGTRFRRLMQRLPNPTHLTLGSALKSCLVAEGGADLYARFGPTSEWDTAAAQCVVEEAGGQILDTQLQPLRYNCREGLLNPHFLVVGTGLDLAPYLERAPPLRGD